jgi:hypothetical protein
VGIEERRLEALSGTLTACLPCIGYRVNSGKDTQSVDCAAHSVESSDDVVESSDDVDCGHSTRAHRLSQIKRALVIWPSRVGFGNFALA